MQLSTSEVPLQLNALARSRSGKYLVLELAREGFGIQVANVREIMGIQPITSIPHTPHYIKGIINIRGKAVPVVDLRLYFGLAATEYTQQTCIVVVQLAGNSEPIFMGIIVDGVDEALNVAEGDIEDAPAFGSEVDTSYLLGIAKIKGQVKMLLDIDKTMNIQDLHRLNALVQ
jgi:purine-binding chemotaxis protein CheW